MTKTIYIFYFTFLLLACSCSSEPEIDIPEDIAGLENVAIYPGDAAPLYQISLEPEAVFGDTDEIFISSVSGVEADESGRVFLADRSEAVVHVYDNGGRYLFSIGGKGQGPGEFSAVYRPRLHNGRLFILDTQNQRVSLFNPTDGAYLSSISLGDDQSNASGFPISFDPLSGNRNLVYYNSMIRDGEKFNRSMVPKIINNGGEVMSEEFLEFTPGEMFMIQTETSITIMSLPFMRHSYMALDGNENIFWGYTDRVHLKVHNLEGEYLSSFYYARPNPPLNRDAMLDQYEDRSVRQSIRALDIPETKPAFVGFRIDDENRIWLPLLTEDDDTLEWWVLSETGEKLAAFFRQLDHSLELVKNGMAYFREESEDGLIEVVRYRIDFSR